MMIQEIVEQQKRIIDLCRQHQVARLYLFGSAATAHYRAGDSDLDFLVTFNTMTPHEHRVAYFSLIEDLEALFHTPVDLIEEPAIRNPYFREEVEETRVILYAA